MSSPSGSPCPQALAGGMRGRLRRAARVALAAAVALSLVAAGSARSGRDGSAARASTPVSEVSRAAEPSAPPGKARCTGAPSADHWSAAASGEELRAFEDVSPDDVDGLSGAEIRGFSHPAPDATVAFHPLRPSQTSPKAGTARGPPMRTERLFSGVSHPHRLWPDSAGVDHSSPCEDPADVRTERTERL